MDYNNLREGIVQLITKAETELPNDVIKALNLPITIPNLFPFADNFPSICCGNFAS